MLIFIVSICCAYASDEWVSVLAPHKAAAYIKPDTVECYIIPRIVSGRPVANPNVFQKNETTVLKGQDALTHRQKANGK